MKDFLHDFGEGVGDEATNVDNDPAEEDKELAEKLKENK